MVKTGKGYEKVSGTRPMRTAEDYRNRRKDIEQGRNLTDYMDRETSKSLGERRRNNAKESFLDIEESILDEYYDY